MIVYYKKCTKVPSLPQNLANELIELAKSYLGEYHPMEHWYKKAELENPNTLNYITCEDKIVSEGGGSGVGLYNLPERINDKIYKFYRHTDTELSTIEKFSLQVVTGGQFVAPHIDPERSGGYLYILKSGGDDVRTRWYSVKDEFKDLILNKGYAISFDRVDVIEDRCLEENTWHWLNFGEIHGVENQVTLRIAICEKPGENKKF